MLCSPSAVPVCMLSVSTFADLGTLSSVDLCVPVRKIGLLHGLILVAFCGM